MSFSTAKENVASERFMLIRLTPARYVGGDLAAQGGGVYSMTFSYPVATVYRNGTELTKVTSVANNDEYSFDEDTHTLEVKIASAPDESSNAIIVYYNLFFTGAKSRLIPEDPESAESTTNILREWEPRIRDYPSIRQSIKSGLAGVLTIDDMQVALLNGDHEFEQYLTVNDSFGNKDVTIWLCIDDVSNIQKLYVGKVAKVRISDGIVVLNTRSPATLLQQPAYMGDSPDDVYTDSSVTNEAQAKRAIPFIIGEFSQHKEELRYLNGWNYNGSLLRPGMLEASCISYNGNATGSVNRTWVLCRTTSYGDRTITSTIADTNGNDGNSIFPETLTPLGSGTYELDRWNTTAAEGTFSVGDSVRIGSSPASYGLVTLLQNDGTGIDQVTIILRPITTNTTYDIGNSINVNAGVGIVIKDASGNYWNVFEGGDYTITKTTLDSGNILYKVVFTSSFEDNYSGMGYLSPDTHTVYFRLHTSTSNDWTHGSVAKLLCESAGLTVDADSISTANAALTTKGLFSIPYPGESDFRNYIDYLEDMTSDMVSVLTVTPSGEATYKVLDVPSSGGTIDKTLIIDGSMDVDVDYEDIVTTVILKNPSIKTLRIDTWTKSTDDELTISDTGARYLHGKEVTYTRDNCTVSPLTDVGQRILDFKKNRRVVYRFETATENLDSNLADDITLETTSVLGVDGTVNLKVISLDKSADKTTIEATDLKGL